MRRSAPTDWPRPTGQRQWREHASSRPVLAELKAGGMSARQDGGGANRARHSDSDRRTMACPNRHSGASTSGSRRIGLTVGLKTRMGADPLVIVFCAVLLALSQARWNNPSLARFLDHPKWEIAGADYPPISPRTTARLAAKMEPIAATHHRAQEPPIGASDQFAGTVPV